MIIIHHSSGCVRRPSLSHTASMAMQFDKNDFLDCCGSTQFAEQMVADGPYATCERVVFAAKDIWFTRVDIHGWLEAFNARPQIGQYPYTAHRSYRSAQWSQEEQSTVLSWADVNKLKELYEWNSKYKQKFGFVFVICVSGRNAQEILSELKKRYANRPIMEFNIASQEEIKIIELRIRKLCSNIEASASTEVQSTASGVTEAEEGRATVLGRQLTAPPIASDPISPQIRTRVRPPITTHVLDVARGCPAAGLEVRLQMYNAKRLSPMFGNTDNKKWVFHGSSITDKDGRCDQLMKVVDDLSPGIYRISFNTGKYNPDGFFPFVSIVFEVKESQKKEHFHVPLQLSPFSFSTYRGS